jgi:hypothetical protein
MGVGCLHVAAWGVVVVVLVEVEFGVALRFCVARRFINWISALYSLLGGGLNVLIDVKRVLHDVL